MDGRWSFEDAREHLDKLVRRARERGPQVLTDHGEDSAVVLSCEEYARLRGGAPRAELRERTGRDFIASWRSSPLLGLDLEAMRNREPLSPPPDLSG